MVDLEMFRFLAFFLCLPFISKVSFGQVSALQKVSGGYGIVPPVFEENRGQVDAQAKYFLRGDNFSMFVTKTGPVLALTNAKIRAAVRLEVVGATGKAAVTGEKQTGGQSSYFRGNDPSKWVTGAPHFQQVRIREVRNGLDLLCYANDRQFEYDLVVKPGAKLDELRLRFAGANRVSITEDGELKIETAAGELTQHRPKIWQVVGERRQDVEGRYQVLSSGEVAVAVRKYDRSRELVIDPVISYSTYLGGKNSDRANGIAIDASGNAYVTGQTFSSNFPTTVGAYQLAENAMSSDVFVSKLNPAGTALLYSTYLGGPSTDAGVAIAVDSFGNAYVTGVTYSGQFPTTAGAFQNTTKSSTIATAFVAKLNASGTALLYSTYLGGSNQQNANGIQVDANGCAYITGSTSSADFPVTAGANATALPGSQAVFVTKLNAGGTGLVYSTFLGGSGSDSSSGIALDNSNNVYISGTTQSANFPTTSGAFQTAETTGVTQNAFVAEISADGTTLKAATYLGATATSAGSSNSNSGGIALDSNNNVYVTGATYSNSFPTTPGAYATSSSANLVNLHAFVTKLNPTLTSLLYSTYLAGSGYDGGSGIKVDSAGRAYVFGTTNSPDFPTTPGSLFGKNSGISSVLFLAQLDPTGGSLNYSTLFGGTSGDTASAVALDSNQGVYLTGTTSSLDYPVTPGAFQATSTKPNSIISDGFVTKLDLSSQVSCAVSISPTSYAAPTGGGSSSFSITAPQNCPWVVYNSDPASVTISGPTHGFGNATVSFTVAQNVNPASNVTGSLVVGASAFSITQPAGSCSAPVFLPPSASILASGGSYSLAIGIPSSCIYSVNSNEPWIRVLLASGLTGNSTITYLIDPNDFGSRSASLVVNGVSYPVTQPGADCTASTALSAGTSGGGGTGVISLTASSNTCAWNAYPLSPWIQVQFKSGIGSALVEILLAPNPGTAQRVGQVLIAGQTVTVTQGAGPAGMPSAYTISTIAGNGTPGFSGDGGPAVSAELNVPNGLAYDSIGNLFIADGANYRVRKVSLDGTISTVAGNGTQSGGGSTAIAAGIQPTSLAFDRGDNLYLGDGNANTISKVTNGIISNFASLAYAPLSLTVDSSNSVYAGGVGIVQKITATGTVSAYAGTGGSGFGGDGGAPAIAQLSSIRGVAVDSGSNVYVSDQINNRVRRISGNTISTVAGNSGQGYSGDGIATSSLLDHPYGLAIDPLGEVIVADEDNFRIRRFTAGGTITTIAGTGSSGSGQSGDGLPALSAPLNEVSSLAIDPFGNIAFTQNGPRVSLLTPSYSFCSYGLSSSEASAVSSASVLSPVVTANNGCMWNVFSPVPWITVGTPSGSGSGSVILNVVANATGANRTATVSIAGNNYSVSQPPAIVTSSGVTPNAGVGTSQVFTALYTDTAGASALTNVLFLINSSFSAASACYFEVSPSGIYLYDDDAAPVLLGPLGASGTLSNKQCTVNGAGSGASYGPYNQTLTLTLSITFNSSFGGVKNLYMYAGDTFGYNSGWQTKGTYTVPSSVPFTSSVTPNTGMGTNQVFSAVYFDTAGARALNNVLFLINSSLSAASACYFEVGPSGIYLYDDDTAPVLLGPLSSSGALSNKQCTVNGYGSGVSYAGNNLTLTLSIAFDTSFTGVKNLYMYAGDTLGSNSGWQTMGTYYTAPPMLPAAISASGSPGVGTSQVFTAFYAETAGATYLNNVLFLINSSLSAASACYFEVSPSGIYLYDDDAAPVLLGPLGASGTLSNKQCSVSGAGSGVSYAGNNLELTLSITFNSSFGGVKNLYMYAGDTFGYNSGWQTKGTFTVPSMAPTASVVNPNAGVGTGDTFTAVYLDAAGASALNNVLFLINSSLSAASACYFEVGASGIYLYDDDATPVLLGPLNAGSTLSNKQCSVSGARSGVNYLGTNLILTLSITFSNSFTGVKNIYMYAADMLGYNSGWQTKGTYTVQ